MSDKKIRGIYFTYSDTDDGNSGVGRKIKAQYESFLDHGYDMKIYTLYKPVDPFNKLARRLPFSNNTPVWDRSITCKGSDFIYFRRPQAMTGSFIRYFRKVKQNNHNLKVIMEIPTYPYDKEISKEWYNIPLLIKDKIARKKLNGLVDRIACIGEEKRIYHIPTIRIKNGFDFKGIPVSREVDPSCIHLACVAWFSFWHGYDRLLNGLKHYYEKGGKRKVFIHFIGDGPELENYQKLSKENGLNESTVFHGPMKKEGIQEILNHCDMGVGALGMYRQKYFGIGASLKMREYMASGLPLMTGVRSDVGEIAEMKKYVLEYPNNGSMIDIKRMVSYLDHLYQEVEGDLSILGNEIRNQAELHFSMDAAMKNVFHYLDREVL